MTTPIGITNRVSVVEFGGIVLVLFVISQVLVVIANPKIITDRPNKEEEIHKIDVRAWRSVVLFGIISPIFTISVLENHGTSLSNAALLLSAGFSIFTFSMKDIARIRKIALRFQSVSFSSSILLLFTSLYFIIDEINPGDEVVLLLQILVLVALFMWILSFIFHLYYTWKQYNGRKRTELIMKSLPVSGNEE